MAPKISAPLLFGNINRFYVIIVTMNKRLIKNKIYAWCTLIQAVSMIIYFIIVSYNIFTHSYRAVGRVFDSDGLNNIGYCVIVFSVIMVATKIIQMLVSKK